jgi:thymidylate synthase ThyX
MMTQTPQRLTADLGYAIPKLIRDAGFEVEYRQAMDTAQEAYQQLAEWNPAVAAYVIPNAFNRRVFMTLNLREVFHFCELRAAPNAHFSVRRVALQLAELIREVHPTLAGYLRLPDGVSHESIEMDHFVQV